MKADLIKEQARALRRMLVALGFESQKAFAAALHVHASRVSCWLHADHPEVMGRETRRILAELLGARFEDAGALADFLDEVGWTLTREEWHPAEACLKRDVVSWLVGLPGPDRLAGRRDELDALRDALLSAGRRAPRALVVHGMAGVGKTALVRAALQDKDVQVHFERMLWVSAEPQPDEPDEAVAARVFRALVDQIWSNGEQATTPEWNERGRSMVRRKLVRMRTLLVLDGVETGFDLDEWQLVDPVVGRLLVTTRRRDLAERGQMIEVNPLDATAARALLTGGVEIDVGEDDLGWLIGALGGLPLALTLANRIARLSGGLRDLIVEMRAGLLASLEAGPGGKKGSARLAFESSYRRLDEEERTLFHCLGLFASPFELAPVAHALDWEMAQTGRALRGLMWAGLVDGAGSGWYAMHSLLRAYAVELGESAEPSSLPAWKARLAEYYADGANWRRWAQAEGQSWRGSIAQQRAHIERGCACAHQVGRGDLVLAYLRHAGESFALSDDRALRERWWAWAQELAIDEGDRARGALEMAEFYLLTGENDAALLLARQALANKPERRDGVRAVLVEIEAYLQLSRPDDALVLLDDAAFWAAVDTLPAGDPLRYALWQLSESAQRQSGADRAVGWFVRAQETLTRWQDGVTAEYAAQVQALEAMIAEGDRVLEQVDPAAALRFFEGQAVEVEMNGSRRERLINAAYRALALTEMGKVEMAAATRREVGLPVSWC